jgi:ABC-2 type transport system permease protein
MRAIFKKEINAFFANTTGFIVLCIYWIVNVLFLWFVNTDYTILNSGNANLIPFFELSAWMFIFLIPAICMKSFSEEQKLGTLELLYTKPITKLNLVLGKFWAALAISGIALLPSLLYVVCIHFLAKEIVSVDFPAIFGSYLGLILLTSCYIAISLLASAWSKNQILSFSLGTVFCLAAFFALEGISNIALFGSSIYALEYLSLSYHYNSLSRGVIDTRNIIYFLSFTCLFIAFCIHRLQKTQEQ